MEQYGSRVSKSALRMMILVGIITVALISVTIYRFRLPNQSNTTLQKNTAQPTRPITAFPQITTIPLPTGAQTYVFQHGQNVTGPKPMEIRIDPLAPEPGQMQTITLVTNTDDAITSANIGVITDGKTESHPLIKSDETGNTQRWSGTWGLNDSYNTIYAMEISLTGTSGTYRETMRFR